MGAFLCCARCKSCGRPKLSQDQRKNGSAVAPSMELYEYAREELAMLGLDHSDIQEQEEIPEQHEESESSFDNNDMSLDEHDLSLEPKEFAKDQSLRLADYVCTCDKCPRISSMEEAVSRRQALIKDETHQRAIVRVLKACATYDETKELDPRVYLYAEKLISERGLDEEDTFQHLVHYMTQEVSGNQWSGTSGRHPH